MLFVSVLALIISIPLSFYQNRFVLQPIFAIMGATMQIEVDPWQAYVLYPGILLSGILCATVLAARKIRTVNIKEMNNLE